MIEQSSIYLGTIPPQDILVEIMKSIVVATSQHEQGKLEEIKQRLRLMSIPTSYGLSSTDTLWESNLVRYVCYQLLHQLAEVAKQAQSID